MTAACCDPDEAHIMNHEFDIAVFPGDGIGHELIPPCLDVLHTACAKSGGVKLKTSRLAAGAAHWQASGEALPAESLAAARASDAILLAAMGDPAIRYPDGTEITPQIDLRFALGLYAGLRPVRSIPGVSGPLSDPRAEAIDFVLVRESIEGLFAPQAPSELIGDEEARETLVITRAISEKLFSTSCRLAQQRARDRRNAVDPAQRRRSGRTAVLSQPRPDVAMSEDAYMTRSPRVTCIDKANVFGAFAFFREIFFDVAAEFDVSADAAYVDIMALNLVTRPWDYDVLVTENMFGDILSDLGAALIGGMGYAPSADIGDEHAVFQPCHGSAPDIAGQGLANPTAMFLSGAMMLEWLGTRHQCEPAREAGRRIVAAVDDAFRSGELVTVERGGKAGTDAVHAAVMRELSAQ